MPSIYGIVYGDEQVEARIGAMPSRLREQLSKAMRAQWLALQAYIVTSKLSGQVLKRKTGNLASSINVGGANSASEFVDGESQIVGRVGTKVWYGRVHEYGGDVNVRSHTRTITQVFGRPIEPRTVSVRGHVARFPERSFLRSGLRDRGAQIRDAIAASVRESMG